jgi:hypothetical protein
VCGWLLNINSTPCSGCKDNGELGFLCIQNSLRQHE